MTATGDGDSAGGPTRRRADVLLDVRDLKTSFETDRGLVRAVDGVSLSLAAGRTLGVVGESGSGKTVLSRSIMGLLPHRGTVREGSVHFEGVEISELSRQGDARVLGRADGDDLPGPDDVAEPGDEDRQADHRVDPSAPRREPRLRRRPGREPARVGAHPRTAPAVEGVPAPALGRYAPAGVHRGRAGLRTEAAVRRRTHDRARRDRAGAGPRPDPPAAGRAVHGHGPHHPRPRRRRRPGRRDRRHVRGAHRGDARRRRSCSPT